MWKLYQHRKGPLYLHHQKVVHSESLEELESYRCLYENEISAHWVRPSPMFFENLEAGPRFKELGRIEVLAPEDERELLLFGYDAWKRDGENQSDFVDGYQSCPNHLRGRRYVLRHPNQGIVAGVNTLRFARNLGGIASLATHPEHRRQGYAKMLMMSVMSILEDYEGVNRLLLFSEIDTSYFERLGFQKLPEAMQIFPRAVAMIKSATPLDSNEEVFLNKYF